MKHIVYSQTKLSNVQSEDIQPNAIDLRLGKVFAPNTETVFQISADNQKQHRAKQEIIPGWDGWFYLTPGYYEVVMENEIQVAEGEAGWVITRSTLNRNGVFLTSGLYDSGYCGVMAAVLHVTGGPIRIEKGTRIGQYINFEAETAHLYDGSYGNASEHDKAYTT